MILVEKQIFQGHLNPFPPIALHKKTVLKYPNEN